MVQTTVNFWLKYYKKKFRQIFRKNSLNDKRLFPNELFQDDIFLTSYPRSGNTWLRFLIANILTDDIVNFQNIGNIIPDIHQNQELLNIIKRPRLIKSHSKFEEEYPKVIYLVRDGRDVYTSYFHYQRGILPKKISFTKYLKFDHWPCSWGEHVLSWVNACLPTKRFLLIKYENLQVNPTSELIRIANFINLNITETQIQNSIRKSTFTNMRNLEDRFGHPRSDNFNGHFVRKGKLNNWKEFFGPSDKKAFKSLKTDMEALEVLGYSDGTDW